MLRPLFALPLLLAALFALLAALPARAAVNWPQPVLVPVVSGLTQPLYVTHAGDGSGRLFVVERAGRIRIVQNGALLPTPFLDIRARVQSGGAEQGLLSVAFPPGYSSKRYFYVYYTRSSDSANVIARYRLVSGSADQADPNSETVILPMPDPYANHNGGIMLFGRDGYLYVGTGDGGSGGDPQNWAQNLNELLGKILRLDVESTPAPGQTYVVPSSNPNLGGRREIWAYGLRNPWRMSFDRQTGDLYVADVGQGSWEEVDFQPAASTGGQNYGWRLMEGMHCYNPSSSCDPGGLTMPVVEYSHAFGCSVTGGYVYRGTSYARMRGVYFYGDYCSGRLWGLTRDGGAWTSQELPSTGASISSFGEDEAGELYLVDYNGAVLRVTDPSSALSFHLRLPLLPHGAGSG